MFFLSSCVLILTDNDKQEMYQNSYVQSSPLHSQKKK